MTTLLLLARRSLRRHLLVSLVASGVLALAGGLFLAVRVIERGSEEALQAGTAGFDAVLGARGSRLQLVLCALFHLEAAPGLIRAEELERIRAHPAVLRAVPLALGDNHRGTRIVGTNLELFHPPEGAPGPRWALAQGPGDGPAPRWFDEDAPEAVVGAVAARRLGIRLGDALEVFHGLEYAEEARHEESFVVVGILEPTGTPADAVIWVPLRGVQHLDGHDPASANDLAAVLVALRNPAAGLMIDLRYNRQGDRLTFAWPAPAIVAGLFDRFRWIQDLLGAMAVAVGVVGALTALAVLHAGMDARARDLAILRILGARRRTLAALLVLEGAGIGLLGAAGSLAVGAALASATAALVRARTGVLVDPWAAHPDLVLVPLALVALGCAAAILPALRAHRGDPLDRAH